MAALGPDREMLHIAAMSAGRFLTLPSTIRMLYSWKMCELSNFSTTIIIYQVYSITESAC